MAHVWMNGLVKPVAKHPRALGLYGDHLTRASIKPYDRKLIAIWTVDRRPLPPGCIVERIQTPVYP